MELKKDIIQQIQTIIGTSRDRAIRSVDNECIDVLANWQGDF